MQADQINALRSNQAKVDTEHEFKDKAPQ